MSTRVVFSAEGSIYDLGGSQRSATHTLSAERRQDEQCLVAGLEESIKLVAHVYRMPCRACGRPDGCYVQDENQVPCQGRGEPGYAPIERLCVGHYVKHR